MRTTDFSTTLRVGTCLLLLTVTPAIAQDLRLLRQVFPLTGPEPDANPREFVGLGPWVFCRSDRGVFRFDRTGAGPRRMFDVAMEMGAAGGKLFLANSDLYVSDGSATPAPAIPPSSQVSLTPSELTPFGARLVFSGSSSAAGYEPWISDGTFAGTMLLADIRPGSGNSAPRALTPHGGLVVFLADDGTAGEELWRTDGTTAGTVLLKDVRPGPAAGSIRHLVSDGARLWFFADVGRGDELWRSDGTPNGTVSVAPSIADPTLTPFSNSALFLQTRNNRQQLWTSDGTAAGTRMLKDLAPASTLATGIRPLVAGSYLYFAVADVNGDGALWRSDGTAGGTILLSPVAGHLPSGATLASLGLDVFFPGGRGGATGTELWTTDGTVPGTRQLADIRPGTLSSSPAVLTAIGNTLYFAADDGTTGVEPWRSDGTAAGTRLVANLGTRGPSVLWSTPSVFQSDHTAWFLRETGGTSVDLWRTDGTTAGTTAVQVPGYYAPNERNVFAGAGRVFFPAPPSQGGQTLTDLWTTDGTQAGTRLFKAGVGWVTDMLDLGDVAVFGGGANFHELWRTDGTPNGTVPLNATVSLLRVSGPRFARLGNLAVFGDQFQRLTVSDGTAAGTGGVAAVAGFQMWSHPVRVGNRIAFFDRTPGIVLTDGTAAGTISTPLGTALGSSIPHVFAANSRGVFVGLADSRSYNRSELWFSDGTAAGSRLLSVVPVSGVIVGGCVWQDRLYFSWYSPAAGAEPWVSDGTVQGTYMLKDIAPGPASSHPIVGKPVGSRFLYFIASSDQRWSLWRTDGRAAGTLEVDPTDPAAVPWSVPVHVNGHLLILADDPLLGYQPHVLDLWASSKAIGKGCAIGNDVPSLTATDPILGGQVRIDLASIHASQSAVLLLGLPHASVLQQLRFRGGCVVLPDLTGPTLTLPLRTDAAGAASLLAPLPLLPALTGARLVVQAAVGTTATRPLRTDLSAGVELKLGR